MFASEAWTKIYRPPLEANEGLKKNSIPGLFFVPTPLPQIFLTTPLPILHSRSNSMS